MNNLRNEKIRSVLLALLLAVSFLILDVEAASPEREQNQDPRGTLSVQYEEVEQMEEDPQADMDSIELEEKLLRARMGERGVRIEEER